MKLILWCYRVQNTQLIQLHPCGPRKLTDCRYVEKGRPNKLTGLSPFPTLIQRQLLVVGLRKIKEITLQPGLSVGRARTTHNHTEAQRQEAGKKAKKKKSDQITKTPINLTPVIALTVASCKCFGVGCCIQALLPKIRSAFASRKPNGIADSAVRSQGETSGATRSSILFSGTVPQVIYLANLSLGTERERERVKSRYGGHEDDDENARTWR